MKYKIASLIMFPAVAFTVLLALIVIPIGMASEIVLDGCKSAVTWSRGINQEFALTFSFGFRRKKMRPSLLKFESKVFPNPALAVWRRIWSKFVTAASTETSNAATGGPIARPEDQK